VPLYISQDDASAMDMVIVASALGTGMLTVISAALSAASGRMMQVWGGRRALTHGLTLHALALLGLSLLGVSTLALRGS
jgi:hypothetical protein